MLDGDIDLLVKLIKNAILNKPLPKETQCQSEELGELQEAIEYLADCLSEANVYLKELCAGNLNVKAPSRHNFLAGSLKELHAVLKHLTWQTKQVAEGDYSQKVNFLGEFSTSFNKMVMQLKEREISLNQKSVALSQTVEMLISIMDSLEDWVVVMDIQTTEVIYVNLSASKAFYNTDTHSCINNDSELFNLLKTLKTPNKEVEFICEKQAKVFVINSFNVEWQQRNAIAHYISDVTGERRELDVLQGLAYSDGLTGLYNRRYCIEHMQELVDTGTNFFIALLDLDGLKYVNDNFGHKAGDEYITTLSHILKNSVRAEDVVCRIGGDEFVAILKNIFYEKAHTKMEEISAKVREKSDSYPMSVSYGLIEVTNFNDILAEDLINKADEKMYEMKSKKQERANCI